MKIIKCLSINLVAVSLSLVACGKSSDRPSATSSKITYSQVNKEIGTNGGQIKDEKSGLGLDIPAEALNSNKNISLQRFAEPEDMEEKPQTGFITAMEFLPSGTTFDKPVEVTVELNETPTNDELSIFCFDETNKIWDFVTSADVNNKTATFNITHFSKYAALDITPSMYEKYFALVDEAIRTGKNDSWITESYEDYLINEKHVMDYYEEFNGFWYEPCGFFIGGSYQINSKAGDGDQLVKRHGESNKVGSTYGYSKVGGETATYQEAKNASSSVDSINITVTIDYKMIKPQIELYAEKSSLEKGESSDVSVYCHYAKSSNTIYPNIDLPGYSLNIQALDGNLKVNKNNVTTNSAGKANFVVTAKNNKGGSVKVSFDVSGDFGTHAEATIDFDEDEDATYEIRGIVKDSYKQTFKYGTDENKTTKFGNDTRTVKSTEGYFSFEFSYSISGTIKWWSWDNDWFDGEVNITDINVVASSASSTYDYEYDSPYDPEEKRASNEKIHETVEFFMGGTVEATPILNQSIIVTSPTYYEGELVLPSYASFSRFGLPEYIAILNSAGHSTYEKDLYYKSDRNPNNPVEDTTHTSDEDDFDCVCRYTQTGFAFMVNFGNSEGTYSYESDCRSEYGINPFQTWPWDNGPNVYELEETHTYSQTVTLTKIDNK